MGIANVMATMSDVSANQLGSANGIFQALHDARYPSLRRVLRRWHRSNEGKEHEREGERGRVDRERNGQSERGNAHARERRPRDGGDRVAERTERGDSGKIVDRNELGRESLQRRRVEAVYGGHERGDEKKQRNARMRAHRIRDERERAAQQEAFGAEQEPTAIDGVGEGAAPKRRQCERHELGGTNQSDERRRLGEFVDLNRQRDVREKRAKRADELTGEYQAKVAMTA
jgi:hypothetical protein